MRFIKIITGRNFSITDITPGFDCLEIGVRLLGVPLFCILSFFNAYRLLTSLGLDLFRLITTKNIQNQ